MTQHDDNAALNRRHWMVLTGSALGGALSGCGGGGDLGVAGIPGTGGTGQIAAVFVRGLISGFGSVIVSGIRFDDSMAAVQVDGVNATPTALRLGMVIDVQGERGSSPTQGTANSIAAWSIAQGVVSGVLAAGEFTVAGMTVTVDASTVLNGFSSAASLAVGQRVTVWGLQADASANRWRATRLALDAASGTRVTTTGQAQMLDGHLEVNGYRLGGSAVSALAAGQLVRVQGWVALDGVTLEAEQVSVRGLTQGATLPTGEAEIEGVVLTIVSATRFRLGDFDVDTSHAVIKPAGASIGAGTKVDVDGVWASGVLVAREIEVENESEKARTTVEIKGYVEQFTSAADFVVRGQRCDASTAVVSHGTLANDLHVGAYVQLKGTQEGSVLRVKELEFGELQGQTQGTALPTGEAEYEGVVLATASATRFKLGEFEVDSSHAVVKPTGASIGPGKKVKVDGVWVSGVLAARNIEVKDEETGIAVEIEGGVEQLVSAADFVVQGYRCDASGAVVERGTLAHDLREGAHVKIEGTQEGAFVRVRKLEFVD